MFTHLALAILALVFLFFLQPFSFGIFFSLSLVFSHLRPLTFILHFWNAFPFNHFLYHII